MSDSILIRLHRPEGYEDVHPELILQDAGIHPAFEPEVFEPPPECKTEAEKTAYAFGWWKAMEARPAQVPADRDAVLEEAAVKCDQINSDSGCGFEPFADAIRAMKGTP